MGKSSGLGARFYANGVDLSGDVGEMTGIQGGPAQLDVTGLDKLAYERIGGVISGSIGYNSHFNPEGAHPVLSALPYGDVIETYCHRPVIGSPAACAVTKQINYDATRGAAGELSFSIDSQSNGSGVEWCELLTAAARTDATATSGAGVDLGVGSTNFGLQAYLQVTAFTGTSCTVKLQQSSDNGAGDAWADVVGGGFVAVTVAPGAQRIVTARNQTVERYLRVVTSGTFTNITFLVAVMRNPVAVAL